MALAAAGALGVAAEYTVSVSDFCHFCEHAKTVSSRTWEQLRRELRACVTCAEFCELVDAKLRTRFLKKRWKGRDRAVLAALETADSVRFVPADSACTMHTAQRPNVDWHAQVYVECKAQCEAHAGKEWSGDGRCGCSVDEYFACANLLERLRPYRRVMCPRQLLALEFKEYKRHALVLIGDALADV